MHIDICSAPQATGKSVQLATAMVAVRLHQLACLAITALLALAALGSLPAAHAATTRMQRAAARRLVNDFAKFSTASRAFHILNRLVTAMCGTWCVPCAAKNTHQHVPRHQSRQPRRTASSP